jgi:hypothetical protein
MTSCPVRIDKSPRDIWLIHGSTDRWLRIREPMISRSLEAGDNLLDPSLLPCENFLVSIQTKSVLKQQKRGLPTIFMYTSWYLAESSPPSGKLASLWQSKEGTYCALGMAGIKPTPSKSECAWTPLTPSPPLIDDNHCSKWVDTGLQPDMSKRARSSSMYRVWSMFTVNWFRQASFIKQLKAEQRVSILVFSRNIHFSPGLSTFLPGNRKCSIFFGFQSIFLPEFSPGTQISGCDFRSTFLSEIGWSLGICPFLTTTPRFFLTELGDVVPKRCEAWNLRKDSFREGMKKNWACPSAWPGIGAYSSSLQSAGPIPGLRRAGGMCQGKQSIYNRIEQDLSRNINNYPGIRARFILVNQELS